MPSLNAAQLATMQKLRRTVKPPKPPRLRMFRATVTAVQAGPPATVDIQQGSLSVVPGVRYDASLTPTVGMAVWGLTVGGDWQVCGTLK